jgi:hypothetical protein
VDVVDENEMAETALRLVMLGRRLPRVARASQHRCRAGEWSPAVIRMATRLAGFVTRLVRILARWISLSISWGIMQRNHFLPQQNTQAA